MSAINRLPIAAALAVFLSVSPDGLAQSSRATPPASDTSCGTFFHIARWERVAVEWDVLTPQMRKWWMEKGAERWPDLCYTRVPGDADYVIIWWHETRQTMQTLKAGLPRTMTGAHLDAANLWASRVSIMPHPDGPASMVETSYAPRRVLRSMVVQVYPVHRPGELPALQEDNAILSMDKAASWPWSRPDRDALIEALHTIAGR